MSTNSTALKDSYSTKGTVYATGHIKHPPAKKVTPLKLYNPGQVGKQDCQDKEAGQERVVPRPGQKHQVDQERRERVEHPVDQARLVRVAHQVDQERQEQLAYQVIQARQEREVDRVNQERLERKVGRGSQEGQGRVVHQVNQEDREHREWVAHWANLELQELVVSRGNQARLE